MRGRRGKAGARWWLAVGGALALSGCGGAYEAAQNTSSVETGAPATAAADDPVEYCAALQEPAPASLCRLYAELPNKLERGVAAFTPPASMRRGDTVQVEFAIAQGSDMAEATDLVVGHGAPVQQFRPKIGRYMAAELRGEGFEIDPAGPQEQDLFLSGAARWIWQVKAVRAPRHVLSLSAWVKAKAPDGQLKPVWFRTVHRQVAVPVRTPDRISDFLDDSLAWIGRLEIWVKALAALVMALAGLWLGIRRFGKPQPAAG